MEGNRKKKENWHGRLFTKHKKDKTGVCTVLSRVLVVLFYDDYLFSEERARAKFCETLPTFFSYSSMFHIG